MNISFFVLRERIDWFLNRIKNVVKVIVYFGLYFLGLATFIGLGSVFFQGILPVKSLILILFVSLCFFLVSLIIYHHFPNRFNFWRGVKRRENIFFWMMPPISNAILSLAFSFYLFSRINSNVNYSWTRIFFLHDKAYGYIAEYFIASPIALGVIFLLLLSPIFLVVKFTEGKNIIIKTIGVSMYCLVLLIYIYLLMRNPSFIDDSIPKYFIPLATYLIGFFPLGWFYELFIDSILKHPEIKKDYVIN